MSDVAIRLRESFDLLYRWEMGDPKAVQFSWQQMYEAFEDEISGMWKVKRLLRIYDEVEIPTGGGRNVVFVWDYKRGCARPKHEMTEQDVKESLEAKYEHIKRLEIDEAC